ncbi:MAG: hypothetical protein EA387_09490 [Nitriliruptor sp.]|nr:MAG: hypothetical protein EA387_09490 [Nitriliruptor sp.]
MTTDQPRITVSEQFLTSPTNHITAIAGDGDVAAAAQGEVDGAAEPGVSVSLIGPEQSEEMTIEGDDLGESLLARVRKILGDETPHLEHLAAALEAGATVVCVGLPDRDEVGDEDHDALKQRVADLLLSTGATDATYHGRWGIEELTTGR